MKLNELWSGTITSYNYNFLTHTITLDIVVKDDERKRIYNVIFTNISSYYVVENTRKQRYNLQQYEEDDIMEVSSIWYYKNGIGTISVNSNTEVWVEQYGSNANLV